MEDRSGRVRAAGWVEWVSVVSAAHSSLCWWGSTNFPLFFLTLLLRFMLQVEFVSLPALEAALWLRLGTQRIAFSDCQDWFGVDMWSKTPLRVNGNFADTTQREGHHLSWQSQVWETVGLDLLADIFATMWSLRMKPLYRRTVDRSRDLRSWWCYQAAFKTPNPWSFHVPWSVNSLSLNWYFCPLQQKESSLVLQWQRYSQGQRLETVMGQSKIHMGWWHATGGGLHESSFFSYRVSIIIEEDKGHCFSPSSDSY